MFRDPWISSPSMDWNTPRVACNTSIRVPRARDRRVIALEEVEKQLETHQVVPLQIEMILGHPGGYLDQLCQERAFFLGGYLGRRSKSYEAVKLIEIAVYFQVSERLNWNMDEIPEVYPFYSYVDWVANPSASVLPGFSWQRAEAIDNRRKSNRGPIVEDIRGSSQKGDNLMFMLNIPHKGYARYLFLETEVWSIDLPTRFERPAGQFTY